MHDVFPAPRGDPFTATQRKAVDAYGPPEAGRRPGRLCVHIGLLDGHWSLTAGHWSVAASRQRIQSSALNSERIAACEEQDDITPERRLLRAAAVNSKRIDYRVYRSPSAEPLGV